VGTFGAGIFDDDVAMDVRSAYLDLLAEGKGDVQAERAIQADWKNEISDSDDGPVFWLALAATQWEYGRLSDRVKRRALRAITAAKNDDRWISSKSGKRRRQVLQRLATKLNSAQPARRTPRRRSFREPDAFRLLSPDLRAEATAFSLNENSISQVCVVTKPAGGGGSVFAADCHCTAIRLKWIDNDRLQISYPKGVAVDQQDRTFRYCRRRIAIQYRRF